jgi:hypothetical protein
LGEAESVVRNGKIERGWRRAKLLWLIRSDQARPVIVRGTRIDRPGAVLFFDRFDPTLELLRRLSPRARGLLGDPTPPGEWREIPSAVFVSNAGCYALQVDGPDFQSTLILRARPYPSPQ